MLIGVPKEIKPDEHRVGLSLSSARELIEHGHQLMVETGAGEGLRRSDGDYRALGARIADSAEDVFAKADLIVKVKEPQASECRMLREGQVLFTYLHLAPDPGQARRLMESGVTAIAYETVTDRLGQLPLLAPMSEVAGRMAVQAGARCLETEMGGCGKLLGGVPGVLAANVVVLGGGGVGALGGRRRLGVDPALFVGAPRLHQGGRVGREVPIIAQEGERVLSRSETAAYEAGPRAPRVEINLENRGSPAEATVTNQRWDGDTLVIDLMLDDMARRGPFTQGLQRTFGLRERSV